jgi:hypothetical protein
LAEDAAPALHFSAASLGAGRWTFVLNLFLRLTTVRLLKLLISVMH